MGFYDNGKCITFDIPTGEVVSVKSLHKERIQSISSSKFSLLATGSYDKTVRLWQDNGDKLFTELNHGYPVESLCWIGNSHLLTSSGGGLVKFWDVRNLKDSSEASLIPSRDVSAWSKTVTCMAYDESSGMLFTGAADCTVRTIDPINLKTEKFCTASAPVLSMNLLNENQHSVVLGLSSGQIEIYRNTSALQLEQIDLAASSKFIKKTPTKFKTERSKRYAHSKTTITKHFRKFRFRQAFAYALHRSVDYEPQTLEPLIECLFELERLKALQQSFVNQNDTVISSFVGYITRFIFNLKAHEELQHSGINTGSIIPLFSTVITVLLDLGYCSRKFPKCQVAFAKLKSRVHEENITTKKLNRTSGVMGMFIANMT